MIQQPPFKKSVDLPLHQDSSADFVPWVFGMILFMILFAGVAALGISFYVKNVTLASQSQLTITVPVETPQERADIEKNLVEILSARKEVMQASPLSQEQLEQTANRLDLVSFSKKLMLIPVMVDVFLGAQGTSALPQLQADVKKIYPEATVFSHQAVLQKLTNWLSTTQQAVWFSVLFFLIAALLVIIFSVRTGVRIHSSILEILHLMGASDRYISRQFQRHSFKNTLQAFWIACFFCLGTLLLLFLQLDASLLNFFLSPSFLYQLLFFFVFMLVVSLTLVHLVTHFTVVWSLRNLEIS
ncbi:MAG: cell division protein FtsX [Alphaproteobacteria bacterium]